MSETVTTTTSSAPSAGSSGGTSASAPQTSGQSQSQSAPASGGMAQGQAAAQEKSEGAQAAEKPQAPAKRYLEADAEEALVKIKVDGQEQEVTLKELKRLNSLEKASKSRMTEAQKIKQQWDQFQKGLQENPEQLLESVLKDRFDEIAEARLAKKFELSQMDPIQRENLELKQRIESQQRAELQSKQSVIDEIKTLGHSGNEDLTKFPKEALQQYRDHLQNVNQQAEQSLQQEMIQAWEQTGVPKHKTWGNWIALEMMNHQKRTGEPLQAKDAALKVKGDWLKFNQQILGQMDAEAIHNMLGAEIVQKLSDYTIQKATAQAPSGFQKPSPGPAPAATGDKGYMTEAEYRAWIKS
jgi:hypothetical protein